MAHRVPLIGLALAMLMHAVNNGLVNGVLTIEYGFQTTFDFLTVGVPVSLADQIGCHPEDRRRGLEGDLLGLRRGLLRRGRRLACLPAAPDRLGSSLPSSSSAR